MSAAPVQRTTDNVARLDQRRSLARARAAEVMDRLDRKGVSVLVTGSLADGDFGLFSDVDFLVTACPRPLKYAIEGLVEDLMGELPFDVIYLDELSSPKATRFLAKAVDVRV